MAKQVVIRVRNNNENDVVNRGISLLEYYHGYSIGQELFVFNVGRTEEQSIEDIQTIIANHGIEATFEVMEPGDTIT